MTAANLAVALYLAGLVCLGGIAHAEGWDRAILAKVRRRKPGRHRAGGRMTWPAEITLHARNEVSRIRKARFRELVARQLAALVPVPVLDVAPLCPPMYPDVTLEFPELHDTSPADPYPYSIGAGRYAHLRIDELTASAERKLRLADFEQARRAQVVDLQALRVRGAVPTVAEVDDDWLASVAS